MSIKPVDFQVVIPKTQELSKISADNVNKNHAAQIQQAEITKHKVDNNPKHVYSKDSAQESRIQQKQEKEQYSGDSKKEKKKKSNNNERAKDPHDVASNTNVIDIKI